MQPGPKTRPPARRLLCVTMAAVLAALPGLARPASAQHALVLSGGGARGIAHAGALLALEELGYTFDAVAGTSMGAIIGSLYAAGYAPEEIRRVIADEDWLARFAAEPVLSGPERVPRRPLLTLGLGPRRYHEGLVTGTGINLRLTQLLFDAGVRARNDFDALPRPLRVVTADLATGGAVVIRAGDLPRAVRASMSVPGAFAPVPWGDRMLVDGGIANNLPVAVARDAWPLPVVAVDAVRALPDAPERNPLDVAVRGLRLLLRNAQPEGVEPDILVLPRIRPGFSEARFPADPGRLISAGYDAVLEQVPPADGPGRAESSQDPTGTPAVPGTPAGTVRVRAVEVEADDPALAVLIRRVMEPARGAYDAEAILRRVAGLYDTGLFTALWPRLEFDADDGDTGTLVVHAVPVTRTALALSARWDDDIGGGVHAGIRHRVTAWEPLELRAAARLDELSHVLSADASAFSMLFPGMIWNAGTHVSEERIRIFEGDDVARTDPVFRTGLWLGAERQGVWFMSLLGRGGYARDDDAGISGWSGGPFLRVSRPLEPQVVVGLPPLLELELRAGDMHYQRVRATVGLATTRAGRGLAAAMSGLGVDRTLGGVRAGEAGGGAVGAAGATAGAAPLAGADADGTASPGRIQAAVFLDASITGGTGPRDVLPAARRELAPWLAAGALRRRHQVVAGADVAFPILLDGYVRFRLRALAAADDAAELHRTGRWLGGGEVGVVWPTAVGPLEAAWARGAGGGRLNISAGVAF